MNLNDDDDGNCDASVFHFMNHPCECILLPMELRLDIGVRNRKATANN